MWIVVLMFAVVFLDRATKVAASYFLKGGDTLVLIPRIFEFRYAQNDGAAWSLLSGHQWLLIAISVAMLLVLAWNAKALSRCGIWGKLALGLLVGGIVGNLADRVLYRYVIDFIQVYLGTYPFPVFNIADSAICLGAGAYAIAAFFGKKETVSPDGNAPS